MKKSAILFQVVLLVLCLFSPVLPQAQDALSNAVTQLLDEPAPPPPTLKLVADALAAQKRWPPRNREPKDEPDADAPPKVVIDYWDGPWKKQPSDSARWRLLEAVLAEPRFYRWVLDYLPDTPEAHDRVKNFLDQAESNDNGIFGEYFGKEARESLSNWLSRHSDYKRASLIQRAEGINADKLLSYPNDDLEALAKLDWTTAQPIIERYAKNASPTLAAYSIGLLYKHCVDTNDAQTEVLREKLTNFASDYLASEQVREFALSALVESDWTGRDEWFVSKLLESPQPGVKIEESLDPFCDSISRDAEHWIPILTKLVGDTNRSTHDTAVFCLANLAARHPTVDALRPLLPWLSNPKWAHDYEPTRYRVVASLETVKMPEAIGGLLSIVQNEKNNLDKTAAQTLAAYREPRAIPVLRRRLAEANPDDESLEYLINALIYVGGLSVSEKIAAIERVATETTAEIRRYGIRHFLFLRGDKSVQASIGKALVLEHLIAQHHVTDDVLAGVLKRCTELRSSQPDVAKNLWIIAQEFDTPAISVAIAERIAARTADLDTLLTALERRAGLKSNASAVLKPLISRGGYAAGISAVLLSDTGAEASILKSKDTEARIGLMASARMVREPLELKPTAALLKSDNKSLRLAGLRYIETVDTQESRALLRADQPGEILILGARDNFDPKQQRSEEWNKWEEDLRRDVKSASVDEVFGQLEFHSTDTSFNRYSVEVRVRSDQAEMCKRKDAAREECRVLQPDELQSLRQLFDPGSFDHLPPVLLNGGGLAGSSHEFLRLNKLGGSRVYAANLFEFLFMNTWSLQSNTPHQRLAAFFESLKTNGNFELRYALKDKIKQLEVLSADDERPVSYVAGEDGQLRVLIKDENENSDATEKVQADERPKWHVLVDGRIGEVTEQPKSFEIVDTQEDLPETNRDRYRQLNPLWRIRIGKALVRALHWKDSVGLWLCRVGEEPELIAKGSYGSPLVTPDGRWLVAVKIEQTSKQSNDVLVRINLQSKKETTVASDSSYYGMTLVPGSNKVLFRHDTDDDQNHLLLDPASGAIEKAEGEFGPLEQQDSRLLQPVAGSNDYWAAITDNNANETRVGRYDTRSFKFTSMITLPGISFTSQAMWVDESANQLYIAYNGHLLRLPFGVKPTQ